mmetsp:Transcript_20597/g.25274  ORF Transcript_20597/g.25274 Transcript_20597/m.25274 type:complete len:473 (-) Transcript_20597:809-2227(-)
MSDMQQYNTNLDIKDYPTLNAHGISIGESGKETKIRRRILSELIALNETNDVKHHITINRVKSQLIRLHCQFKNGKKPLGDPKVDRRFFRETRNEKRWGISAIDEIIESCAEQSGMSDEYVTKLLLGFLAKKYPSCYVEHQEMAQQLYEKKLNKPKFLVVSDDYVNHDGSGDTEWNLSYMELMKYKEANGDCNVPFRDETGLGKFVKKIRQWRSTNCAFLTPRRIQLLEDIGFAMVADPNRKQVVSGGCPRFNKAVAARLVYPQLSVREALYVGGHTDEEMDVKVDSKHTWRTGFVILKDKLNSKIKHWESLHLMGTKKRILDYVSILRSSEVNKHEIVFGHKFGLLEEFLNVEGRDIINANIENIGEKRKAGELNLPDHADQSVTKYHCVIPEKVALESSLTVHEIKKKTDQSALKGQWVIPETTAQGIDIALSAIENEKDQPALIDKGVLPVSIAEENDLTLHDTGNKKD